MAAWLAYLKSRLLLPPDPAEDGALGRRAGGASGVPAASGSRRCARAAARLMARDQLGRDVFARGEARGGGARACAWCTRGEPDRPDAGLCPDQDPRRVPAAAPRARRRSARMEAALERMRGLIGTAIDWTRARRLAAGGLGGRAAAAALGDGRELRRGAGAGEGGRARRCARSAPFAPIYLRAARGRTRHERDRPGPLRRRRAVAPDPAGAGAHGRGGALRQPRAADRARDRRAAAAGRRRARGAGGAPPPLRRARGRARARSATPGRSAPPPTSGS